MISEKPSLDELTVLEHHGVKGMHWGVRRNLPSPHLSDQTKKRLKIAGGVAVGAVGVAATAYILSKHGGKAISHPQVKAFDEAAWKRQTDNIMTGTKLQAVGRIKARDIQTNLHPSYLQGKSVQKHLPDHMFMRWDEKTKGYVQDAVFGYNPNTGRFGRSIHN